MEQKLKLKNFFGYAIADLGNNIAFAAASSYLVLFYTDVLGAHFDEKTSVLWGIATTVLMIVARVWDGINDPIMGFLAQKAKPTRFGKFRHYLLFGGIPLALISVFMFAPIMNMSLIGCICFAFFTYVTYGMLYTVVLVPYGSLATVMTRNENERSLLSIARSIGGGIGGIPAGMLFPILVYSQTTNEVGKVVSVLDGKKLVIAMAIIGAVMIICYVIAFLCTKEQFPYPKTTQKMDLKATLKTLVHNKPFVIMSLAGMLLIASSMFISTIDIFLFNIYYKKTGLMLYVTIATYLPMAALIPFTKKIIEKVGKKETCVYGLIISTVASLIMAVWRLPSAWLFIAFCFLQGVGVGFFTLEVWAMAMDVIDYQELLSDKREEATGYAIFTFMRKIGQAIAAIVPAILTGIGYVAKNGYDGQTVKTENSLYTVATVIPFVLFALMLVLMCLYPLNKKRDKEMREKLGLLRRAREESLSQEQPTATAE